MTLSQIQMLLVEDNPGDAKLVRMLIREAAPDTLDIAQAETLAAATALLEAQAIDVVLLDLGLPDSQGLETFTLLHDRFPRVPMLILTGGDDEELGNAALQAGAQDYLMKTELVARNLARALRYAMERHRLRLALANAAAEIRNLQRLLPICASCKKIRDEQGQWEVLESYLSRMSPMGVTHGIFPECSVRFLNS